MEEKGLGLFAIMTNYEEKTGQSKDGDETASEDSADEEKTLKVYKKQLLMFVDAGVPDFEGI